MYVCLYVYTRICIISLRKIQWRIWNLGKEGAQNLTQIYLIEVIRYADCNLVRNEQVILKKNTIYVLKTLLGSEYFFKLTITGLQEKSVIKPRSILDLIKICRSKFGKNSEITLQRILQFAHLPWIICASPSLHIFLIFALNSSQCI